jgi:hypothetical protein
MAGWDRVQAAEYSVAGCGAGMGRPDAPAAPLDTLCASQNKEY